MIVFINSVKSVFHPHFEMGYIYAMALELKRKTGTGVVTGVGEVQIENLHVHNTRLTFCRFAYRENMPLTSHAEIWYHINVWK